MTREEQVTQRRERVALMQERLKDFVWQHRTLNPRNINEHIVKERVDEHDVAILGTRYNGTYEGAKWVAWLGDLEWLDEYQGNDVDCMTFWYDYKDAPIGRGATPNDALADLVRQAREVSK